MSAPQYRVLPAIGYQESVPEDLAKRPFQRNLQSLRVIQFTMGNCRKPMGENYHNKGEFANHLVDLQSSQIQESILLRALSLQMRERASKRSKRTTH